MFGKFHFARRSQGRHLAPALMLGAAVIGAVVTTAAAQAQDKSKSQAKGGNSQGFAKIYQPMAALVNAPTGDFASIKPQVPGLLAAVQNADDKNLAGNLILILGNKTKDRALQRQGLQLMVESGKVPAEKIGQFNFLLGNLAYDAKDYAGARSGLEAAKAAGFKDDSLEPLLAETYFNAGQTDQGFTVLKSAIAAKRAAGGPVPDVWLRRGLQVAYDKKMTAQSNEWAALLVSTNPTTANWTTALQVVNQINAFDPQVQLDLLRLMAMTNSLSTRNDYVRYIEAADPRVMSNEVNRVLASAVTAGMLKPTEAYYGEVKRVTDTRASADRTEAPKMVALARSSGKASDALNAGDVLYSLGQYAQAEEMYQLAATKGGPDKDKALTRLGIAQAQQNKTAAAKASFAQVSGVRAPVAQMWQAYLSSKA